MRALPDLAKNIKCGNSLVSHDYYEAQQGLPFSEEARLRINAFDWPDEFGFRFDAVIGNPPYGADYTEAEKKIYQGKFIYKRGKPETSMFFLEQGLRLLNRGGLLSFIMPNAWLTNYYGLQVRAFLLQQSTILGVADLEPVRVFRAAVVDTCVVLVRNEAPTSRSSVLISRCGTDRVIRPEFKVRQRLWDMDQEKIFNVYANEAELQVMSQMEGSRETLASIVDYSQGVIPYKTKSDGKKNKYIAAEPRGADWKPLFESASQVEQYQLARPEAFIHYGRWLWCARDPKYFERPKILFHRVRKKLPRQLIGAMETSKAVNRHALSNLILLEGREDDELWAVLALFNSDLVNWWFIKRYGPLMEVGGFKVQTIPLPQGWAKIWPTLAIRAKDITMALKAAAASQDGRTSVSYDRQAQSNRKIVERLLAKGYGLTEEAVLHTSTSFQRLVDRSVVRDSHISEIAHS